MHATVSLCSFRGHEQTSSSRPSSRPPRLPGASTLGCGTRLGKTQAVGDNDVALVHGLLHIRRTLSRSGREPVFGPPKSACRRRAVLVPQEAV